MGRDTLRPNVAGADYFGPFPERLWTVLEYTWRQQLFVSADFARYYAVEIALAASLGWISNIDVDCVSYNRTWHITVNGLIALTEIRAREADYNKESS